MKANSSNPPDPNDLKDSQLVLVMMSYGANRIHCIVANDETDLDSSDNKKLIVELGEDIFENHWFIDSDGNKWEYARALHDDGRPLEYADWIKNVNHYKSPDK